MAARSTIVVLVALSLLAPALLSGAQAQNDTDEDSQSWVDCWEDDHGAGCEAVASTSDEAWNLLEEAEADGRTPFSLDDENVSCQEEAWDDRVSVQCWQEQDEGSYEEPEDDSWVECWDSHDGTTCEAWASNETEAYDALEQARADGRVPVDLDDPRTECHTEQHDSQTRVACTHRETLVDCWEEDNGTVCEAWGETIDDARAKFDQAEDLPLHPDDEDVRCEEQVGDRRAHLFCFRTPQHETPEEHGEAPPPGEPDCTPLPEEGVVECAPPPACEGKLGETQMCTPPPECEILDPDTVHCPMEAAQTEADAGSAQPDCEPHASDPAAMVCRPPPECEGKIGETAACTPPPECQPQGDGTFLCKLEERHDEASPEPARDEPADRPTISEELDAEIEDAVREALAGFREHLDELRTEYEQGKAELAERYEQTKDRLRSEYQDCLDELPEDAERVDEVEKELACKQEARQALAEEREVLLAERDLLREDLLSRAESKQFQTCQSLEETLHGILMDHGQFDSDLGVYLGPEDLGLCAGILLDAEVDTGSIGGWGGGGDR